MTDSWEFMVVSLFTSPLSLSSGAAVKHFLLDVMEKHGNNVIMRVEDLQAIWGSQAKVAVMLRCSQSAVAKWVIRNAGAVPWPYQCVAYYVSGGKLKPNGERK